MDYVADIFIIIGTILFLIIFITLCGLFLLHIILDRKQKKHSILRNYPLLGRIRYFLEKIGPELRQYWFNSDTEGKPFFT